MSADAAIDAPLQLSWVLPLHRTAAQLEELVARIHGVATDLGLRHEVILVDDACPEHSGVLAQRMAVRDPRLRVLRLERHQGQDRALIAGLRLSRGEWTVVHDADLQDPPEAVARMWPLCTAAHDAVFARRTGRYSSRGPAGDVAPVPRAGLADRRIAGRRRPVRRAASWRARPDQRGRARQRHPAGPGRRHQAALR